MNGSVIVQERQVNYVQYFPNYPTPSFPDLYIPLQQRPVRLTADPDWLCAVLRARQATRALEARSASLAVTARTASPVCPAWPASADHAASQVSQQTAAELTDQLLTISLEKT